MSCGLINVNPGVVGIPAMGNGCVSGAIGAEGGGGNGGGAYLVEFPEDDEPSEVVNNVGSVAMLTEAWPTFWSIGGLNDGSCALATACDDWGC